MLELESSRGSNPDLSKKREVMPEAEPVTKVKGKETRRQLNLVIAGHL